MTHTIAICTEKKNKTTNCAKKRSLKNVKKKTTKRANNDKKLTDTTKKLSYRDKVEQNRIKHDDDDFFGINNLCKYLLDICSFSFFVSLVARDKSNVK